MDIEFTGLASLGHFPGQQLCANGLPALPAMCEVGHRLAEGLRQPFAEPSPTGSPVTWFCHEARTLQQLRELLHLPRTLWLQAVILADDVDPMEAEMFARSFALQLSLKRRLNTSLQRLNVNAADFWSLPR